MLHTSNVVNKESRTMISKKQNAENEAFKGGLYTDQNKTDRKLQDKNKTY